MLRGINGPLDLVGMEKNEVGVGGVVARQDSFLGEPLAVVAAQNRLQLLAVGSQNAGRNAEVWELLHGEIVEVGVGSGRSPHAMPAKDDHLFELGVIDGLSCEGGDTEKR